MRYYKDIKELFDLAEKGKPKDIEQEIKKRIYVLKFYMESKGLDWGIGAVVKNWNAILDKYYPEVQDKINLDKI